MLDKVIRILNFDNSITSQSGLLKSYPNQIIDLSRFESHARLYSSRAIRREISSIIPKTSNYPTFLGSGDFHHISEVLTSRIEEPFCLIVFDFHPDWEMVAPRFSCGSWVNQALKNKNILKCVIIGASSDDLSFPALQTANFSALAGNRLEVYPYRHKLSRVFLRNLPQNKSISVKNKIIFKEIAWHEIEREDLTKFVLELAKSLPVKKAYLSIDKDCLKKEFALTNWEQGLFDRQQLLSMLRVLRSQLDIIGLDICGDYSPVFIKNKVKALISKIDHPGDFTAANLSQDSVTALNQETNLALLGEIFS